MNGQTLDACFDQTAARLPLRPALSIGSSTWTYAELREEKQRIAELLRLHRLEGAGRAIGVLGEKSLTAYASLLGILASGNIYMPLSPRFPDQRLVQLGRDAALAALIAEPRSAARAAALVGRLQRGIALDATSGTVIAEAHGSESAPPDALGDPALAYLLYTSGSTGIPKGVAVSHRNASAFLDAVTSLAPINHHDRCTQLCELAFDFSIGEIFLCWQAGACLFVPSFAELMLPVDFVNRHRLTVWSSVPTIASNLHRLRTLRPGTFPSLRLSMFCGEALPTSLAQAWLVAAPSSALINFYGPTEATVFATIYRFDPASPPQTATVPIGRPFAGMETRVAEHGDDPAVGELLLAGPQVVEGYWRNRAASEAAFIRTPEDPVDRIWYRTGDLVSQDPRDGFRFHGRCDDQLKLQGHRVELAEIEAVLLQLRPDAMTAAVPVWAEDGSCESIVAFCSSAELDEPALLLACRALLPDYMVPRRILPIEPLPLTHNGKIDRSQLARRAAAGR